MMETLTLYGNCNGMVNLTITMTPPSFLPFNSLRSWKHDGWANPKWGQRLNSRTKEAAAIQDGAGLVGTLAVPWYRTPMAVTTGWKWQKNRSKTSKVTEQDDPRKPLYENC